MRQGDTVIFIEDESPEQRATRKNNKRRKRVDQRIRSKVAHLDVVDKVTGKKVKFKKDKKADFDKDDGRELPDSRVKRERDGEPVRRAYICPPNAFPLPRGLQANIESIEIDEYTLDTIREYDKTVRESRGEVVERRGR